MGNHESSLLRRLAAAVGLGAFAVLSATALHLGSPTGTGSDAPAKGTPTMQMGQTLGHLAPAATTTTTPGR